jgi:DNA invertase Pin-like site-specific DNA recombinase
LVEWFYDPTVSGADPIETRPGFSALLDRIEGNGVRAAVVEDASRFARDLVAQELGILLLIKRGVRLFTASGDDLCDTSDPSRVMMRQIASAFAQYEKSRLVARLKKARARGQGQAGRPQGNSAEYLQVDLGSIDSAGLVTSSNAATATLNFSTRFRSDIGRVGIAYKFSGYPAAPAVYK